MVINKDDLTSRLKELKPYLAENYGVASIGFFGSFAGGNPQKDSDIDILVDFNRPIGFKFFSLEEYLESVFGRKVDLVTKSALKSQFKDQILKQVIYI